MPPQNKGAIINSVDESRQQMKGESRRSERHARALGVGYQALRLLFAEVERDEAVTLPAGYKGSTGHVGSMEVQAIYAAITGAVEREGLLKQGYHSFHSIYHAVEDALEGILRNPGGLGATLRTAGLTFALVRGPRFPELEGEGDWIAVAMFGTVGPPRKGWEHEVVGLGINHV